MSIYKYIPEGWNNKINKFNSIQDITNVIDKKEILQGYVKSCDDKYNLHIELGKEIFGIIPRDEVEAINVEETGLPKKSLCTGKVHKFVQFKIKNIDNNNNIILSRKQVQSEALEWVKNDLKEGQKVEGIVKNITRYGAFIEIGGGIVGLAHIEDLSIARIKSPYERLKIGQKINVVIKSIDKQIGRVILSYKEILGTWEENIQKFSQGTKVKGIIREIEKNKNGLFIELAPNLVGMSEYVQGLEYGQKVDVYIKKIDTQKKKVKLIII